jgi:hypothetical protein
VVEQTLGQRLRRAWMAIVARFGHAQTLVMLSFVYVCVIGPGAAATRLIGRDLLDKRRRVREPSSWHPADSGGISLERAKLQA